MPTSVFKKDYFNFSAGLFTDGGYLNTPPNTANDLLNVRIDRDASIRRRKGIDYEDDYVLTNISIPNLNSVHVNYYIWENPGNISGKRFLVVQSGINLYVFEYNTSESISNQYVTTINLAHLLLTDFTQIKTPVDFATGKGKLFLANERMHLSYISYNSTNNSFSTEYIYPRIRDLVGLTDGIPNDATVGYFLQSHYYNLLNRGWTPDLLSQTLEEMGWYPSKAMIHYLSRITYIDPVDGNPDDYNKFSPQKLTDVYNYFGNASAPQGHHIIDPFIKDRANPESGGSWETYTVTDNKLYVITDVGFTGGTYPNKLQLDVDVTAPYVENALGTKRSQYEYSGSTYFNATLNEEETNLAFSHGVNPFTYGFIRANVTRTVTNFLPGTISLETDTIRSRPKTVGFYNGRLCFAGTPHEREQGRVYISQIVNDSLSNIAHFYQEADPTSEHINALVDTDGFVVEILEASNIIKLVQVGYQLLAFAENGVWAISGSDIGAAAKPTDFTVTKITNIAPISLSSILIAGSNAFYVARDGIYVLRSDQVSGQYTAVSIVNNRIYNYWTSLPQSARQNARLVFNESEQELIILLKVNASGNSALVTNYDTQIIFNNVTQSILVDRFSSSSALPFIFGAVPTSKQLLLTSTENVVDNNGDNVIDSAGEVVTINQTSNSSTTITAPLAYLTLVNVSGTYKFTVAQITSTTFKDWYTHDSSGQSYNSYIQTGYLLNQEEKDYILDKHIKFLYTYFKRTETSYSDETGYANPSSCLFRTKWDFSDSDVANKWTDQIELYRFDRPLMLEEGTLNNGYPITSYRHSLNGNGVAVQLRFESNGTNDFHLYGWSIVWEITPLI